MPSQHLRLTASSREVEAALESLRADLEIPAAFPPEVLRQATEAADQLAQIIAAAAQGDLAAADSVPSGVPRPRLVDARQLPLVTIDPPRSTDLDQALSIESHEGGWRLHYAIASVAEVVEPGSALDQEVHRRAVTVYGPTGSFPLHPPVISSGVCSLLPEEDRIALLWQIDLDAQGNIGEVQLTRSLVRSRAKLSYAQVDAAMHGGAPVPESVPEDLPALLREVGRARQALELARGGASLNLPDQDVVETDRGYELHLRSTLPVENWNAQVSITTGIAAAHMMTDAGRGVLRVLPPADPRDVEKLRRTAQADGIEWRSAETYGQVLARMDAAIPAHAAFLIEATALFRGSGYHVLDASGSDAVGQERTHAAIASTYAHVTAPLRRLVDRYGLEVCLALSNNAPIEPWIDEGLATVAADMASGGRIAQQYARGAVDAVEALLMLGRAEETFEAVIVDVQERPRRTGGQHGAEESSGQTAQQMTGNAHLIEPPVHTRIVGDDLEAGTRRRVRVQDVDVLERRVVVTPG